MKPLAAAILSLCCATAFAQSIGPTSATPEVGQTLAQPENLPADLGLKRMVRHLLNHNKTIGSKRNEQGIAVSSIDRAEAAFQTNLNASVIAGDTAQRNTAEDRLFRPGLDVYRKNSTDYSAGLSKLFATGAKVEVKGTLSQFLSNVIQQQGQGDNYRTYYGLSITQPLARDAGPEVTLARLHMAELDAEAANYAILDIENTVTAEAAMNYLDLSLAQERVKLAEQRIQVGQSLLRQANDLFKMGRLPESDVWEVENSLVKYQSALSEAQQLLRERANKLRTMLMALADSAPDGLNATDPLPLKPVSVANAQQSLKTAFEKRKDFQMRRVMAEREGIQISYAENQGLPRIDLVASYGLNGLELSAGRATDPTIMGNYASWNVGVQFSMPLGENLQAKADLSSAKLRKEDALLSLQALEVAIVNDVDTTVGMLNSSIERWNQLREVSDRETKQLELERKRLDAGRSGMREIIYREERASSTRFAVIEQQVAYAKAEMLLNAAQGTLLDSFQ
jgi:outer membrane protein TolC